MLFERDLKHIIYRRVGNCLKKRGRNQNTFFLTQLFRCNPKLTKIASIKILKIYAFYSTIDNTLLHQNALFTSIYIYTHKHMHACKHTCAHAHTYIDIHTDTYFRTISTGGKILESLSLSTSFPEGSDHLPLKHLHACF